MAPPCTGRSDTGNREINGNGWVKVNFSNQYSLSIGVLPIDPTNNGVYHYTYHSDGMGYEINTMLESIQMQEKMRKDGGDNQSFYEKGTKLTLLH
jgi:hypothetical protein